MAAIGILIASAQYKHESKLSCCPADVETLASLLESTGRFDAVHTFVDCDAAALKGNLRDILQPLHGLDELFFYYSGHGYAEEGEFFLCPVDFDRERPNVTGLSDTELLVLIRDASPALTVQVIDACQSGTRLLKSSDELFPAREPELKNLVRIAACGETEDAIAGSQLSPFTERFCLAAAPAREGPVYYMDIITALRDEYRRNPDRAPQFVLQGAGRDTFVDDAQKLAAFRSKLTYGWDEAVEGDAGTVEPVPTAPVPTLADRLAELDARMAKKEDVPAYIDRLFDGLLHRLRAEGFGDAFDLAVAEHKSFHEQTTRGFIIRVLNQEQRPDEFVTATITKHRKKHRSTLFPDFSALTLAFSSDDEVSETWHLELNMAMDRAQLRITLTPRYSVLQRVVLVVSCAPSLEHCYVFELGTRHPRTDWDNFAVEGMEFTRRWYKEPWTGDPGPLIEKIVGKLVADVEALIEETTSRLSTD
ncbi:MAG: caspase domain-containing protein [Phenylobacterium sp.]|uniref:caspase family protein n=1 Tax=Phenylobacterium sp. TaxID=1871053 RepID=UPI00391C201F